MSDPLTYANSDEYVLVNPNDPKVGHLIYDAPMVDADTKQFIRDPETGKIKVYRMVIWGTKGLTQAQVEALITEKNATMVTRVTNVENRLNTVLDSDDTDLDQLSELVTEIKANRSNIALLVSDKATKEELQSAVNTINANIATVANKSNAISVSNTPSQSLENGSGEIVPNTARLTNTVDLQEIASKYIQDLENVYANKDLDNVSAESIFNLQNCDLSEQEITETLHNNIFRGHNLLDYFNSIDAIQTAVQNGDFSKIFIGDYIPATITYSGTNYTTNYRVAGINTFKNYGDTALTRNHLVLIPDRLFDAQMNTSNTTSGGYVGSRMYTTVLPALLASLAGSSSTPFYGKIISHRELFTNAENNWAWYDNSLCLLSEMEAYGSRIFASDGHSIGFYAQMPLFKLNSDYISKFNNQNIWLRSVYGSANFCFAGGDGRADGGVASRSLGVRPRFLFG